MKREELKEYTEKAVTRGIRKTRELKFYLFKFAVRIAVFLAFLFLYLTNRENITAMMFQPITEGFTFVHALWILFMVIMLSHLIPNNRLSMAWKKAKESEYRPADHDPLELAKYVQKQNVAALIIMLVWLSFNAIFGILCLLGILLPADLLMLTVFFFLCDYICILIFCPFQTFFMKNKCCINCRIYDWGHFMMFTPMLFIPSFYSWSLFFTSLVVLLHWEISYARHPERFWEGSNKTLQCANCKERTCQLKNSIRNSAAKRFAK
ncbi:MAG: hypothetical protein E7Z72_06095 [Methanocorpusculum parvum]|nr:hypothetical protein [Methanocorpusculum parvum]